MDIQERSGVRVLSHEGDLTIFEASEFHQALLSLHKHDGSIELDMTEVERIDSSGIQLMLAASRDVRFSVNGMTPSVRDKILSIGCANLIKSHEK